MPPCCPARHLQEEIDIFLTQQPASEDAEYADEGGAAEAAPPAAKRMRGGDGAAAPAPGALPASLAGSFAVALSARRFASVRHYGTRWMVDVREFYQQSDSLQVGWGWELQARFRIWRQATKLLPAGQRRK